MMSPRRTQRAVAIAFAFFAVPGGAGQPEKTRPAAAREGMEALEAQLDRAADRVSLPHAARLLGRAESARGYRLPGYGVVFVLTPRALPGGPGQVYVLRGGSSRHRRLHVKPRSPVPPQAVGEGDDDEVEAFERQVLILQREAETARLEAEEEMERIVLDVRKRVSGPPEVQVEVAPPPEAPPTPAALAPPGAPNPPTPPNAPLPPPPPWKFWFETGAPQDERAPEAVVADVRAALIDALVTPGVRLGGLGGDERVTVTVDFVPGGIFVAQARPETTLVVSARVRDVEARARGAISPDELRKRVEVTIY